MKILLAFLSLFALVGCSSQWQTNEDYLDYLSSIVIRYQVKHGKISKDFGDVLRESKVILPNRGDIDGYPLVYYVFPPNSFMFRSYGKNRKDDKGLLDDLDVYYINGAKVNRREFISEFSKDPIYREVYSGLFEK